MVDKDMIICMVVKKKEDSGTSDCIFNCVVLGTHIDVTMVMVSQVNISVCEL